MQNKGLVKLFALLFGLVSIYQLSFTFKANQVEGVAKEVAINKVADSETDYDTKRNLVESRYLDSLSTQEVFDIGVSSYTFKEVKEKSMNLGLDLKGGISVILQISVKDILKGLANESTDPVFNKALDDAEEIQKNSQNTYLEDFYVAFDAIKGDTKLASPDIFANRDLSDEIRIDTSDDEVKSILSRKVDEAIVSAFEVLRKRIDQFGVTQPNIQRLGTSGRILVELPGVKDKARATELITATAQLEFWDAFKGEEFSYFLFQANEILREQESVTDEAENTETDSVNDTEETTETDEIAELLGEDPDSTDVLQVNPIIDLIRAPGYAGGPVIASFELKDKQRVADYLSQPEIQNILTPQHRYAKFLWGLPTVDPTSGVELVELYALQGNRENKPPLSGAVITDARQ
jgi:SecD/SecF fusion protein